MFDLFPPCPLSQGAMRSQQPQTQAPKQNPQAFQPWTGNSANTSAVIISRHFRIKWVVFVILFCDDEEKWGGSWWWWCQWCDCEKNLLTPSCCPFPRAKAEEELWTHSNEQSEVAQREAPKGPSKNKSWPWQKHRHKPSDRGWPFWRGTHVEQLQESESRPRDVQTKWETETQKTQTQKWNTGCQERPSRDTCHFLWPRNGFFWPNGDLPPSFVRLQSLLDALMRTGLRFLSGKTASNKKYREHVFLFVVNEKANKIFG